MTEKTLDERVAEALGFMRAGKFRVESVVGTRCEVEISCKGFFTKSIANCEKYIEPVLSSVGTLRSLICEKTKLNNGDWIYYVIGRSFSTELFSGRGDTKEIAYCYALFDFNKEKAKREVKL